MRYVYFIREGVDGAVKIGSSGAPRQRMSSLQCQNPRRLSLLAVLPMNVDSLETDLQERFARLRLCGEWFRCEDELLTFIVSIPPENLTAMDPPVADPVEEGRSAVLFIRLDKTLLNEIDCLAVSRKKESPDGDFTRASLAREAIRAWLKEAGR
jgi:hypothetical protein